MGGPGSGRKKGSSNVNKIVSSSKQGMAIVNRLKLQGYDAKHTRKQVKYYKKIGK